MILFRRHDCDEDADDDDDGDDDDDNDDDEVDMVPLCQKMSTGYLFFWYQFLFRKITTSPSLIGEVIRSLQQW